VFALNELIALDRADMLGPVVALKNGESVGAQHPATAEIDRYVEVLPAGSVPSQAAVLADRIRAAGATAVHGYFAHDPAAVAAAAAKMCGLPYGFSVHALDARKVPRAELAHRAEQAALVVSCNPDAAAEVSATGVQPCLVRHGVDLNAFAPTEAPNRKPVTLLAVGRMVEKKGFSVLLDAIAKAPHVRLRIAGDGVLRADLCAQLEHLGLTDRVRLLGRQTHATLPRLYQQADVVVVPSVVDSTGDRDGLPNVVLEAMASQRPVIASDVAAISTAVHHGVTGILVKPGDPHELAAAIEAMARDAGQRAAMGAAGRRVAEVEFALDRCAARFCRTLERAYG
jgi:glycosyltransferase involved in cell wall biosynthesis